jgi:type 1 glutamine amidotransferase
MKKALISWGGWEGHEPQQCAEIFSALLRDEQYQVEIVNTLDCYLDVQYMQSLNLIVPVWTMSAITKEQAQGLLNAVKDGVGIAGAHGGLGDSFRANPDYQWMAGGQWVAHPGGIVTIRLSPDSMISRCIPSNTICTWIHRMRYWRRQPSPANMRTRIGSKVA